MIWRPDADGWKIVLHQGTMMADAQPVASP
jgi:hypothetical protein